MSNITRIGTVALAAMLWAACGDEPTPAGRPDASGSPITRRDEVGRAQQPASLLVLAPTATAADRTRLETTLAQLGGDLIAALPPRLMIAQVPPGAEAVLADLGVVARFDRATTAADLAAPSVAEERFLAVHAARWFPGDVAVNARLTPTVRLRAGGEREGVFPARGLLAREGGSDVDPDDAVAVPYASGTIVVSVILPESNGAIDVSTEDWTEAQVRESYLKVTAALDRIAASDPGADLRFVVHYESAPAAGGLDGTVDTVYEFGQRANWGAGNTEFLATADVLGKVLGRELTEWEVFPAALEYTAGLKRRYQADGAFFVIVAANGNGTAGLRAHAYINGPWTVLDSGYGHETFAHEYGHIFGAYDEYCPDACVSPAAVAGYLGIYNANAQAQEGSGGVDDGHGESAPSLMQYNQPGAINGYTRGAWGWLDTDGDGVIEVRDTAPASELRAEVDGRRVRITGRVVDRPQSRVWAAPYSVNRIVALEYAFAADGPWARMALAGDTRGRQDVDVELGEVPAGERTIWLRAINSIGNLEPRPMTVRVLAAGAGNSAPHGALVVPARGGAASPLTVTTRAIDLDGDPVTVRYDHDGDGAWDTGYLAPGPHTFTPAAGVRAIRAELRDAQGATRVLSATVPVVSGATPATITLGPVPSLVHGASPARITATVAAGAAVLSATAELATDDDVVTVPVTIAGGVLTADLPTPRQLRTRPLDLGGGDRALGRHDVRDLLALDANLLAVAAGTGGVWFVDITDRAAPRVVAQLALETTAHRLLRAGNRLYVLGTHLTIIDLTDVRAPRVLLPGAPVTDSMVATADEQIAIGDGDGGVASHFLTAGLGARITRTTVQVTIEHARPADLTIRLVPQKDSGVAPIVLWDHRAAAGGVRTLTFSSTSTAALRALDGTFADGFWSLEVTDDVGNGALGRLLSSRLELATRARATRVLDGATELAGVTSAGHLVVAGQGVEVLDVSNPHAVRSRGRIAGTGTTSASMIGNVAIIGAPLEAKDPDGTLSTAPVRGLCAIDVAAAPRRVRCDVTLVVTEHAQVAGRLYVGSRPRCERGDPTCAEPSTIVGDAARFAAGLAWRLGATPLRVDRWAFGDAARVWTISDRGTVERLDVHDPAAITVAERFLRTFTSRLVPLRLPEVVLFDFGVSARLASLTDAWSILSRVYRLTVTATDAAGVETRAVRHVHVIPYDHAPTAAVLAVVPARDGVGPDRLQITVVDPDDLATWDPVRFARVDWDGDGAFDGDWLWIGSDGTGGFTTDVEIPAGAGPRTAVVEVRDGFWARARATITLP